MAEYLASGVYVEEFDTGIKVMEGVKTSVAGFVGMTERGVTNKPQLITSMLEYKEYFGGYLGAEYGIHRFLSYAVEQFFSNGGSVCYVMSVANIENFPPCRESLDTLTDTYANMYIGKDEGPSKRSGLQTFLDIDDVSIMAIPGICDAKVQSALLSHCENMTNRFAVLDAPLSISTIDDLKAYRDVYDSSYGALYHPWLQIYDSLLKQSTFVPPSGTVAGIYARVDNSRGVWKAPANEIVKNVIGLSVTYNEGDQGKLNPSGINLIRNIAGTGIRVWGARTCSSDGNWKYLNVRRLCIYIEQSIKVNTKWAVFEPNEETLWTRVSGTIRAFLTTLWRDGALVGTNEAEAFFVNIGRSTMTQDDILNGRLIIEIGIAPVRPTEFMNFRIVQKMEDRS